MLSQEEYNDTLYKFEHISATGKTRQNIRAEYRKKLHEHKLASKYPPFTPLPYQQFFINNVTHELTLLHVIETVQCSKKIILDTESINIINQSNEPALIQLQLILPTSYSYLIIVEVWHLPPEHDPTFQLIKLFFNTLFNPGKTVYIWGTTDELKDFVKLKLFSKEQISLPQNKNCQAKFKNYWNNNYQHKSKSNTLIGDSTCKCESCLGIHHNDLWSLQNATAYGLNMWLDKRYSRSQFNIGLDPQLKQLNDEEIEDRQQLIHYAANDCLSMHQILLMVNYFNDEQTSNDISNKAESIMSVNTILPLTPSINNLHQQPIYEPISDEDNDNEHENFSNNRKILFRSSTPSTERLNAFKKSRENDYKTTRNYNWKFETTNVDSLLTSSSHRSQSSHKQNLQYKIPQTQSTTTILKRTNNNNNDTQARQVNWNSQSHNINSLSIVSTDRLPPPASTEQRQELTEQERRRIHNRSCTVKQRQRMYEHTITCRHFDPRFRIKDVKKILRQIHIDFLAVNPSKPSSNGIKLFIGIRDKMKIEQYKRLLKNYFTHEHYEQLNKHQHQYVQHHHYRHRSEQTNNYHHRH